jgi:hypothetical protein
MRAIRPEHVLPDHFNSSHKPLAILMFHVMLRGKEDFFLSPASVGRLSTQPPARRAYAPEGELREKILFGLSR